MNIILASQSPRRKELLKNSGIRFKVLVSDICEERKKGESGQAMVRRLSKEKAIKVAMEITSSKSKLRSLVIAADTTVVSPRGQILEKPKNKSDAFRMIRQLSGRTHHVFTGYTIVEVQGENITIKKNKTIKTTVEFRPLSMKEIRSYINWGESMDKAGAYAAQGAGMLLIKSIRGSYTNVVGLPMAELLSDITEVS